MSDPDSAQSILSARDILISLLTIAGSFAGAWIASKLALGNYYRQQIWDRKAAAYTTIFESIHAIERWHEKHFDASVEGTEISEERQKILQAEANKAEEDLERCLAGQRWILPPAFYNRSLRLTHDLRHAAVTEVNWQAFLQRSLTLIDTTTRYLNEVVHKDLGIKAGWIQVS
jgi:hypothetical protein